MASKVQNSTYGGGATGTTGLKRKTMTPRTSTTTETGNTGSRNKTSTLRTTQTATNAKARAYSQGRTSTNGRANTASALPFRTGNGVSVDLPQSQSDRFRERNASNYRRSHATSASTGNSSRTANSKRK